MSILLRSSVATCSGDVRKFQREDQVRMISIKALAFMPQTMPQARKVNLKIFLDDNARPTEREEDLILKMRRRGLKIVGRKDYISVQSDSRIAMQYNLIGPKEFIKVKQHISIKEFPKWTKNSLYYVKQDEDYHMEGEIDVLQAGKFVTSFEVKAILTHDAFDYSGPDKVDAVEVVTSSESEYDSKEDEELTAKELERAVDEEPVEDAKEEAGVEPTIRISKPYAESNGIIGKAGGVLELEGCAATITIPRDALEKDVHIKIELIPNLIKNDVHSDKNATLCHAFRCSPPGCKLKKPMTISCEHCARIAPSVKSGDTPIILYSSKENTDIDDETMRGLAGAIETDQQIESLGRALGFSAADINRFLHSNRLGSRTTFKGTSDMLFDWKQKVDAGQQRPRLKEALKKAGLVMLAETHLGMAKPNEALSHSLLADLAGSLWSDEVVEDLGRALGCSVAELNRYTATNKRGERVTFRGTQDMLLDWRQKVSPGDQIRKLKEALDEANLAELSETYLTGNVEVEQQELRAPECRIDDKTIEFDVDELSTYELRVPTESLNGKVVGYLAFHPITMPKKRKPVLNFIIYDNVQGRKKGLCEEMEMMGRVTRDVERLFVVDSAIQNGLDVSCSLDETEEIVTETLDMLDLNLGQNILDFDLDFTDISMNEGNVKITISHGKRRRNSIFVVDMKENSRSTAWENA
ncbi:uncharacterized protein LOC129263362 [Lytechinus pictus]|uniref:uncharacterized protein LOC129263362 n=1 Tax=Lytechinus pictus TaxID=7653 RepID=UPI0030B9D2DA